MTVLQIIVSKG